MPTWGIIPSRKGNVMRAGVVAELASKLSGFLVRNIDVGYGFLGTQSDHHAPELEELMER